MDALTGCFTGPAVLLRLHVLLSKLLASLSDSCPSSTGKSCQSMIPFSDERTCLKIHR